MMNGPSSSASTAYQKCPAGTVVTSGRGGPRWPWLPLLLPSALGCLAGQHDGVVGEIQRRRTTPPCLGRRRGVAAARRLARRRRGSSHKAKPPGVSKSSSRSLGGGLGRPGGVGTGGRALRGVWVFGLGRRLRRPRRARRFFCDGYLSSGRWSFPCGMVSMGRRERSGVSDTGFALAALRNCLCLVGIDVIVAASTTTPRVARVRVGSLNPSVTVVKTNERSSDPAPE